MKITFDSGEKKKPLTPWKQFERSTILFAVGFLLSPFLIGIPIMLIALVGIIASIISALAPKGKKTSDSPR